MSIAALARKPSASQPQPVHTGFWASKRRINAVKMVVVYTIVILGGIFVSIPFIWMLSTSLKVQGQVFLFPPVWMPHPVMWSNYYDAFTAVPFGRYFLNTIVVAGVSVVGIMISSSLAGYAFARLRWPGRDFLFVVVLATMMLPSQVTLVPQFILFRWIHWIDTFLPLIVPACLGSAYQIFLFRQFFSSIPREMDEAARIDGCSFLGIYYRIILPMSLPALATGALFAFRFRWDQFLEPLIFLNSPKNYTIALGLRMFQGENMTSWNLLMAASCVAMLPVLLTFFIGQRYFVQGIVITGVKG